MNGVNSRWTSPGFLGPEGRVHDAGMQRMGGDGGALKPPGQLVGEQDVGQLGLVVGPRGGI